MKTYFQNPFIGIFVFLNFTVSIRVHVYYLIFRTTPMVILTNRSPASLVLFTSYSTTNLPFNPRCDDLSCTSKVGLYRMKALFGSVSGVLIDTWALSPIGGIHLEISISSSFESIDPMLKILCKHAFLSGN